MSGCESPASPALTAPLLPAPPAASAFEPNCDLQPALVVPWSPARLWHPHQGRAPPGGQQGAPGGAADRVASGAAPAPAPALLLALATAQGLALILSRLLHFGASHAHSQNCD